MTIHSRDGQPGPLPDVGQTDQNGADPLDVNAAAAPDGTGEDELSAVGMLCQDILSVVCREAGVSENTRTAVGARISNILIMFDESQKREQDAKRKLSELRSNLRRVNEKLAVLQQEHFGASSEKGHYEFGDDDAGLCRDDEDEVDEEKPKGKRVRKVPRDGKQVEVHHFPENRSCYTCGSEMPSINNWSSTQIRVFPEHVEFVRNIYHTCACNHGICKENRPVSAKTKSHIMKGRSLDLGFVVEAAVQKFFEHTPTFRMERRLLNNNVNLSRQAIGNGIAHLSEHFAPVQQALLAHAKAGHVAQMDETPVRVLAPGKGKCETGYFWVICRDERPWNPQALPAVVFHYAPSRAGSVAAELLSGASLAYLQTDGYSGYKRLFPDSRSNDTLTSVRCWAHSRRKFREIWHATKSKLGDRVIKMIRKMYAVEKAARGLSPGEREAMRQERSLPVLNALYAELTRAQDDAQGAMKIAINYTLKAFDELRHFIFDGRLEIDNNGVERCIRAVALTKKNSLYAGSHAAAEVWAIYYSLIESARLNGINPRSYLNWLAQEIERTRGEVDYAQLLPWHCPVGRIED